LAGVSSSRPLGVSLSVPAFRRRSALLITLASLALAVFAGPASAASPTTSLVSVSSTAVKNNGFAVLPAVTPDGRYVVFFSDGTSLVSPPPGTTGNLYLRDRARATTTLVAPTGSDLGEPQISNDGRWVVFVSNAPSLPGAGSATQVYLWDRESGTTRRLSTNTGSGQTYEGIHEADMSEDGSRVVYSAFDNDAGPRDDTFLVQLPSGTVRRIGEASPGVQANAGVYSGRISGDGQWAIYSTAASNLELADTNGVADIYRENLDTGAKQRVSITSDGGLSSGSSSSAEASRDGCVVAFSSTATNMAPGATTAGTRTFVRDICQNTTEVVSVANDGTVGTTSGVPEISGDGCVIGFKTGSPILAPAPTGRAIGVRDRCTGVTSRIDVSTAGEPGDGSVNPGSFSLAGEKGRYVAFSTVATNLAPGDGDANNDIYLRDRANNVGPTVAVTTSQAANRVNVDLSGSRDPDGFQLTGATSFGDGSTEVAGLVVSHDYPHAGTYTVAVTVTDADGASSRDYRTVTVTDPPPSGAGGGGVIGPGGGNGRGGAGKLTLSAKLSRARFAVAPAHGKAGAGQGATLTATLSDAATLTLTFERQRKGHRSKGKCVAGGGKPKCTFYERAGSLNKSVGAGSSQIALTGRLGSKALAPGPYRLVVEAKSASGSTKATLSFTVTKASK
jgi:Tol biopolymer transport system component